MMSYFMLPALLLLTSAANEKIFTGPQIHSIYEVPLNVAVFLAFTYLTYRSWLSWKQIKMNAVKHITVGFTFLSAYFGLRSLTSAMLIIHGIHPNILHGVEATLALLSVLFFMYSLRA